MRSGALRGRGDDRQPPPCVDGPGRLPQNASRPHGARTIATTRHTTGPATARLLHRALTVDDGLDLWAHWRRGANLPPTGGHRSALRRLYAEGDEFKAGGRRVDEAERVMKRVRVSLRLRVKQRDNEIALYANRTDLTDREREVLQQLTDDRERLIRILRTQPHRASQLASPGMIHGPNSVRLSLRSASPSCFATPPPTSMYTAARLMGIPFFLSMTNRKTLLH